MLTLNELFIESHYITALFPVARHHYQLQLVTSCYFSHQTPVFFFSCLVTRVNRLATSLEPWWNQKLRRNNRQKLARN